MIEHLEARIAPASVVTYFDIDGDLVKITASKGPLDAADLKFVGGGANGQLAELAIFNPEFSGANITFSVTRKPGGDGLAHVGLINGAFVDLGKVVVKGDLGEILAGDTDPATTGLASLQVRSMGTFGSFTQGTSSSLESKIVGKMGPSRITKDFAEVLFFVTGGANGSAGPISIGGDLRGSFVTSGSMGAVTVGGDLIADPAGTFGQASLMAGGDMGAIRIGGMILGGPISLSGLISSHGNLVSLSVHGSVIATSGNSSGRIQVDGNIGSVAIGGSLIGLSLGSGSVVCLGNIGSVRIGGDLMGDDNQAGSILANHIGSIIVGGDLIGGSLSQSGAILAASIGSVRIGGSIVGGQALGTQSLEDSGAIVASGRIGSVSVGGSLIGSANAIPGLAVRTGAIIAGADLGPVRIGGNIVGNDSNAAVISALGSATNFDGKFDTAIASITVRGTVHWAQFLAGFDLTKNPANADASIGVVKIGGDWTASSIVAGAMDTGADGFGVGDSLQTTNNTALVARIASIQISGVVSDAQASTANFGFVAQQIVKLKIEGRSIPLTPAKDSFTLPFTDGVHVLEV